MQTIVIATGGFDPVHSGHINYLNAARALGDRLIVGANSDAWLERKKGRAFMPWSERSQILANLRCVDEVIQFDDSDGSSRAAILWVREHYPAAHIIFANGGDRVSANIPEMDVDLPDLEFRFAVGGATKANSSSWILEEWKAPKTLRTWGYYRVLHTPNDGVKVKELTVKPGGSLSMQRHRLRAEHWFIAEGHARVFSMDAGTDQLVPLGEYTAHQSLHIDNGEWHQLTNASQSQPLRVIEIQYGDATQEEDIERRT